MSLTTRWIAFRNLCLRSPRFHAFATRFPLTRPIVRKRQSELFDLVSGFVYSQILSACIELDVLAKVGDGIGLTDLATTNRFAGRRDPPAGRWSRLATTVAT